MSEHSVEKDAGTWKRLEQVTAVLAFKCPCGGEVEIDLEAGDLDGATSVGDYCDDCGRRLLIYADVDVRTSVLPPAETDVTKCPDCGQTGRYDRRVIVDGRGVYTCPDGHRWQDADETPDSKGYAHVLPPAEPEAAS